MLTRHDRGRQLQAPWKAKRRSGHPDRLFGEFTSASCGAVRTSPPGLAAARDRFGLTLPAVAGLHDILHASNAEIRDEPRAVRAGLGPYRHREVCPDGFGSIPVNACVYFSETVFSEGRASKFALLDRLRDTRAAEPVPAPVMHYATSRLGTTLRSGRTSGAWMSLESHRPREDSTFAEQLRFRTSRSKSRSLAQYLYPSRSLLMPSWVSRNGTTWLRHLPLVGRSTVVRLGARVTETPNSAATVARVELRCTRTNGHIERTYANPASHPTASATRLSKTSTRIAFRWAVPTVVRTNVAGSCRRHSLSPSGGPERGY